VAVVVTEDATGDVIDSLVGANICHCKGTVVAVAGFKDRPLVKVADLMSSRVNTCTGTSIRNGLGDLGAEIAICCLFIDTASSLFFTELVRKFWIFFFRPLF
jgi:hypothetical protein